MITPTKKHLLVAVSSLVKTALVACLILGLGWTLVQIAAWKNAKPVVEAGEDGSVTLTAADSNILGPGGARLNDYAGKNNIGWWDSSGQSLMWHADIPRSGTYRVELEYSLPSSHTNHFDLTCGDETLSFTTPGSGGWDQWKTMPLGQIKLTKGGGRQITLKPTRMSHSEGVMNFVRLHLQPVD